MSAKPGDTKIVNCIVDRNERIAIAIISAALALPLGATLAVSVTPACAVLQPRTVSRTLVKVGESLCKNWEGLANVTRIGQESYTFQCAKYATFANLEVTLQEARDCTTDTECEAKYGPMIP